MAEASRRSAKLQTLIDRLQARDSTARDELIGHACERLGRLTRKMRKDFARLKRWEDTDDVLQNASLRLWHALEKVTPASVEEFFCLAAVQIRRELIDLARHYSSWESAGTGHARPRKGDVAEATPSPAYEKEDTTYEPSRLAIWSEFHRHVDSLPEEERQVFDLLWYQELTQGQAASLLEVSLATIKRRWLRARRLLHEALKGELPGT